MNKLFNNSSAKSVSERKYRRLNTETRIDSEERRPLTPAFEVNHLSQSAFQRLIHWHESYAQALGPKAMHDGQARAEQLKHRKWVHMLIMAALSARESKSVGTPNEDHRWRFSHPPDVEGHGKRARLVLGTLGVILLSTIFSRTHWH